ncbi:ABC transporter substrate-binding protein [Ensifer sp. ENS05]|uniref:ABC transporter substrate-binding protein n=1 Tax=Ensifer sp. ENS05 TaxID=2769277 RepID=UPI00177C4595|nr:ABC transporter substrate-binding protein [Ensifer sp. ENS05]MBD9596395.1 ABC transporter substrate-binding protein [Ensifer sp. ENS05]
MFSIVAITLHQHKKIFRKTFANIQRLDWKKTMYPRYPAIGKVTLKAHVPERSNTHGVYSGEISSPLVELDICGPKNVAKAFKPLVRERAFDVSELSLMTYLQARAYGKPLVLLPAVVLARFQHGFLACLADAKLSGPKDLEGKRIAIRSYTVTTVTWMRAILQRQFGVDVDRITWVAFEDSHLAEFKDPLNVERIELGDRTIEDLVLDGTVDAAVLAKPPINERLRPVIADPQEAAKAWLEKQGALQVNHLYAVDTALSEQRPDVVRAIYGMLKQAKSAAPKTELGIDLHPFGIQANRRNFEVAIACAYDQKLIQRRFAVEDLFDETTLALDD